MPNRNSLSQSQIEALLDAAQVQEHIFWHKEFVASYLLPCGFTVLGRGACIDPANFDLEIGRKVAREDAVNQLWKLEGYRKQLELYNSGELMPTPKIETEFS